MLARMASGNPSVIARLITWDATLVEHHLVLINTLFATIQLLIGLGIAFRPTLRPALAPPSTWALGVWWFGERLGEMLNGVESSLNGAPGAVIIYALLAVLLWPADRQPCRTVHRRQGGGHAESPGALARAVAEPGLLRPHPGEPGTGGAERHDLRHGERPARLAGRHRLGRGVARRGTGPGRVRSTLAAALVVIAAGVYLPRRDRQGDSGPGNRGGPRDLGDR